MNIQQQKELALSIASRAFQNKTDLSGAPYMLHLNHVAEKSAMHGDAHYIVGLLHDLLEDCPEWTEGALRQVFSAEIVDAVAVLTNNKGYSYQDYIKGVLKNEIARQVKRHDLIHNMDLTRIIRPLTDGDIKRLQKYHTAYLTLQNQPK